MYKACIFDLDGTLAYTLDSMARAANEVLSELGLSSLPTENFRYYCGEGASMLVRRCLRDAGDPEERYFDVMEKMYRERFNRDPMYRVRIYEGMEDALTGLKRLGAGLAVCSNKPHEATVKVIHDLFGDLFDVIIGQGENIRRKPAPDVALFAAERLGAMPQECLYIGDSKTDMMTGTAAGMDVLGALWGYRDKKELLDHGACFLAERPEDILYYFKGGK